jgi:TPP-dependent pyruvate/acetoin dehydrogenase alpha subunit
MKEKTMNIPQEKLLEMYRNLLTARCLLEKIFEIYHAGGSGISSWHRGEGEEAITIAICAHLRKDDYLLLRTRVVPCILAKGLSLKDIIASEFVKDVPKVGGHGTYYHIEPEFGILGRSHTLGEDIPIYTGAAVSSQMRGTDQVTVIMIGDGGASRGPVHEAMVVAAAWNLPVIFVLQNNQYGYGTSSRREVYKIKDFSDRAKGYGFPGVEVDGNDIIAVYEAVKECVDRARRGGGPSLIAADTYRLNEHVDPSSLQPYRPKGEAEEWRKKDPLPRYQKTLIDMGMLTSNDVSKLETEVKAEINEAAKEALTCPRMSFDDYIRDAVVDGL